MKKPMACLTLTLLLGAGAAAPAQAAGCSVPMRPAAPKATAQADAQAAPNAVPNAALLAQVWACTDGRTVVTYPQPEGLRVVDGDCQRTLPPVPAGSGTRFEDRSLLFWSRGSTAQMRRKPGRVVACREFRQASLLEDARVRGVTFRGQGGAPRWLLEVGPGAGLTFTPPGDTQSLVFPRLASISDAASGTTAYTASAGGHTIRIKLTTDTCTEGPGAPQYPGAVTLEFDGVAYAGCGVPLSR